MHLKRWITGLIALPFLVFFIYRGGIWFSVLIAVVAEIGLWEYFRIVLKQEEKTISALPVVGFLVAGLLVFAAYKDAPGLMAVVLAADLMIGGLIVVMRFGVAPEILSTFKKQVSGIVYVPLFVSFLILIRNGADGFGWIIVLLGIIFAGDTCAFYVGTYYGRHKLSPSVSPGKTVEGALGGLAANLLVGALGKTIFLPALSWPAMLLFSILAGAAGQIGDLFESVFKRSSKIKDSGGILPGHGGVLDRIDALLFAAPLAYFFKVYIF